MTGTFLSAWIMFPLVLLLCSAGCGLLVRRVSGKVPSPVLVLPVGFALIVAISAFATSYSATASLGGPVVAVLAAAGLVLEIQAWVRSRRGAASRTGAPSTGGGETASAAHSATGPTEGTSVEAETPSSDSPARWRALAWLGRSGPVWLWPTLAALVAFVAIGGPAFLTGTPTWSGYTRIVDIAFQMDFSNYLAHAARVSPPLDSSYNVMIQKLTTAGYPGGGQATLGAMTRLVGLEVPWGYQAYLAFAAAMGALAVFSLIGAFTRSGILRALGAAVAIEPNILYGYSLSGGIKELTAAVLLLLVIALLAQRLPGDGPRRGVLPTSVAVAAAAAAFSFGILPWLGIVFVVLLAVTIFKFKAQLRHLAESWALLLVAAGVLAIPTLVTGIKLLSIASAAIGGTVELGLGNLAGPVPAWSSAGVWLTGDYRYPLTHVTVTHVFDVVVIVLGLVGFAVALRRRRWALAALGVSVPIALYYWTAHTGPWIQFKAFAITGTMAIAIAFAGAAAMSSSRRRLVSLLGLVAVVAIAGSVLYGNAVIYHDMSIAPAARYENLAEIGKRYAGQGPTLYPAFDEYSEYFLREEHGSDLVNPAHGEFDLVPGAPTPANGVNFSVGTNEITQSFLQRFPLIVMPRNPIAERPPSDYELIEQSRYFQVWRRERSASSVLDFKPLAGLPQEHTKRRFCKSFLAEVHKAGAGADVAYAEPPEVAVTGLNLGQHPDYWVTIGPDAVLAAGAGTATVKVTLAHAGHYSIWMEGSVGRALGTYLDGRRLGTLSYEERYPGQFLRLGEATLTAGVHTLRVVRGNGTLHPGSGDGPADGEGRTLGAIVLRREDASNDRVYVAPASAASRVCSADVAYQWLEVVRPSGVPANAIAVKR